MAQEDSSSPRPLSNQELTAMGLPQATEGHRDEPIQDGQFDESEESEYEDADDESEGQEADYAFDTDESEEEDYEDEEYEDGEYDEDLSPQESKKLQSAEKQMREFQSKYDAEKARNDNLSKQFDDLVNQFNTIRQQQPSTEEVDLSALEKALGDSDDYVYVSDVLKQVKQHMKPSEDAQYKRHYEDMGFKQSSFLNQQPDIQEIRSIAMAPSPEQKSYLENIPTDQVGLFYAIKAQILEKNLKEMKKSHGKSIRKVGKRKTPIPPTSGSGKHRKAARRSPDQMGEMEKLLYNYGKKLGRDLSAKVSR